jgi:hypothetical protein
VANYHAVSNVYKLHMRDGRLLLFRSVVTVVRIISMIFEMLKTLQTAFIMITLICSLFYMALSIYNLYIYSIKTAMFCMQPVCYRQKFLT